MRFYVGTRVDEIVAVYPSGKAEYPTTMLLRNGHSLNITGEWRNTVSDIEDILARNIAEENALPANRDVLISKIEEARTKLAALNQAASIVTSDDANAKLAIMLTAWLQSGRQYLREDQKQVVRQWLDQAKAEVGG